jgi:hypothetical protein
MLQKKTKIINTVIGDEQNELDISEDFFKKFISKHNTKAEL